MSKQNFGGWIRYEADNLLKGWATDRDARQARLVVDVMIDGRFVAAVCADRFDPKLVELGEGDGRYAFVLVVPSVFRDGQPHSFSATIRGGQYPLKCKTDSFSIPPAASVPSASIVSAGYGAVFGRLTGGQYQGGKPDLELWLDGRRLDAPVQVVWGSGKHRGEFRASFDPELCDADGDLVLAAPGMMEAALPASPLKPNARLESRHSLEGVAEVDLRGDFGWLDGRSAELALYLEGEEAEPLVTKQIGSKDRSVAIETPSEHAAAALDVGLLVDGQPVPQLRRPSSRILSRMTRNSAFQIWRDGGAEGWEVPPGVDLDRGFYVFPERVEARQGVSGHFLHLQAELGPGEHKPVLVQRLGRDLMAGGRVEAALMVRASHPITVGVRITGASGETTDPVELVLKRPWAWGYGVQMVGIAGDIPQASVELMISAEEAGPVSLDVAGVRLGGQGFSEAPPAEEPAEESPEAVENAALTDWPRGVAFKDLRGRNETASGWFIANQRFESPVQVQAQFADAESSDVSFAFAAAEVSTSCRLEVRLDLEALRQMSDVVLRFEAGAPLQARRLLGGSTVAPPEFQILDRIRLLRREHEPAAHGYAITDRTLAIFGRRLLLTNRMHPFSLAAHLDLEAETSDFDWEAEASIANGEYFLAFEFARPFAAAIRKLSLTPAENAAPAEPGEAYLALEDRAITEQVRQTRGLELWSSPEVIVAGGAETDAPSPMRRWDWRRHPLGSVEVLVCVHNAPDETLACLNSLLGGSTVPHTVQIIDDASDPGVGMRIEAFIADKPWMRLVRHAENQGYTTSADQGLRASTADWVILLNSDTIVTPGWIEGLLEVAAEDAEVAFVGPLSNAATFQSVPEVYDDAHQFKVNRLPAGWTPAHMAAEVAAHSEKLFPKAPLLNGFCTLMRRSVFLEVGGMNREAFPRGYGEENDLCTRVVKAGYKLAIADHVYVYHSKSASFGDEQRKELAKAGNKALRLLHPDVDYAELTTRFFDLPALVRLRAVLREAAGA